MAVAAVALLAPSVASAQSSPVPGHFRGVITAKTQAGRAYHTRILKRDPLGLVNAGTSNLAYNGGPVMHSDTNYAIYWEPSGYSTSSGYKSIVNGYFGNVAAASGTTTNDYSIATQYSDGAGKIAYRAASGREHYRHQRLPVQRLCLDRPGALHHRRPASGRAAQAGGRQGLADGPEHDVLRVLPTQRDHVL